MLTLNSLPVAVHVYANWPIACSCCRDCIAPSTPNRPHSQLMLSILRLAKQKIENKNSINPRINAIKRSNKLTRLQFIGRGMVGIWQPADAWFQWTRCFQILQGSADLWHCVDEFLRRWTLPPFFNRSTRECRLSHSFNRFLWEFRFCFVQSFRVMCMCLLLCWDNLMWFVRRKYVLLFLFD